MTYEERLQEKLIERVDLHLLDIEDCLSSALANKNIEDMKVYTQELNDWIEIKRKLEKTRVMLSKEDPQVTTDTEVTYDASADRTVVWRHTYVNNEPVSLTIAGWYFGEPDDEATNTFSNDTHTAYFEL